jgi:hypothetical protein
LTIYKSTKVYSELARTTSQFLNPKQQSRLPHLELSSTVSQLLLGESNETITMHKRERSQAVINEANTVPSKQSLSRTCLMALPGLPQPVPTHSKAQWLCDLKALVHVKKLKTVSSSPQGIPKRRTVLVFHIPVEEMRLGHQPHPISISISITNSTSD